MTDLLEPPFRGTAIYNPQLLSREELLRSFIARQEELSRVMASLRREAEGQPQHHLVVGARGMGKTTLLARLRFAIADDEVLARRCLPLVFPEEQYNVGNLADFWLNCVDALADVLEAQHDVETAAGLDEQIARIQGLPAVAERRQQALNLLCDLATRLDRRLVLLVDNVDMVLDRLASEDWALREVLSAESRIQLIGATSAPLESHYRHDRAFYDFFRVHHLKGLTEAETFDVLRRLAAATGAARVIRLLDEEPDRIKTVRSMSGGNPRTVVLLFTLLERGVEGDVRTDLERLLDLCTPLYKHRIEVLPAQVQQVLDALAMHWDPATAAQVATATHLTVNTASSQLERLVKDGTVEKVQLPGTRKLGFQIAERFFNIWCLMRASRRVRRRLAWLVEFLRRMYGLDELTRLAQRHLSGSRRDDRIREAEMGLALADAIDEPSLRYALETDSVRALCDTRLNRERLAEILDLDGADAGLASRVERLRLLAEARDICLAAGEIMPGWDPAAFWERVSRSPSLELGDKHKTACLARDHDVEKLGELERILAKEWARFQTRFDPSELEHLSDAIHLGDIDIDAPAPAELEAAALVHGSVSLIPCALAIASEVTDIDRALFTRTIQDSRSPYVRLRWAQIAAESGIATTVIAARLREVVDGQHWDAEVLADLGVALRKWGHDLDAAEEALRLAIDKSPDIARPRHSMGLVKYEQGQYGAAEQNFREAIARDPNKAATWQMLAMVLYRLARFSDAEVAYRRVLVLQPNNAWSWDGLGDVLKHLERPAEAEQAYREALKLDPTEPWYWADLATILHFHLERFIEAEQAYREALARRPNMTSWWHTLGRLLQDKLGRSDEAEGAFREAVTWAPENAVSWNSLAWNLYTRGKELTEAVAAARTAGDLDSSPYIAHTVATVLVASGEWAQAEPWARRFIGADAEFLDETWPDVLRFFAEAVTHGFHAEARALLVETGLGERWEPMVRALEVVARGVQQLGALAPEMREAVRLVLVRIAPDLLAE